MLLKSSVVLLSSIALSFSIFGIACSAQTREQGRIGVVKFPSDWSRIDEDGDEVVMYAPAFYRVWKLPGTGEGELLFTVTTPGEIMFRSNKWFEPTFQPSTDYSKQFYAVSLDGRFRVRKVAARERQQAVGVLNSYRQFLTNTNERGVIYDGKTFAKTGRTWGKTIALPSPNNKWIAVFSYTSPGKTRVRDLIPLPGSGESEPPKGEIFVDIYDIATGEKIISVQRRYSGSEPSTLFYGAMWVEDRYFVMPLNLSFEKCFLATLPSN